MFQQLVGLICFLTISIRESSAFILNNDTNFHRWPAKTVQYFIPNPSEFTPTEISTIQQAMTQITNDLGGCVRFNQIPTLAQAQSLGFSGINYVMLTKSINLPAQSLTCATFPGVNWRAGQAQYAYFVPGPDGCLANPRQAMRILASLLGLRAEFNKPNRDQFVTINTINARPITQTAGVFTRYAPNLVMHNPADYDYNSISNLDPQTFSNTGAPVVTALNGVPMFNSGRLSMKDCQALSFLYSCTTTCQDVYGSGPLPTVPPGGTLPPTPPPLPTFPPSV